MPHWSDEYITLIEDCEARESRMTDWEQEFISSIRNQVEDGRRLSHKQSETLDDIWEKVTAKG